MVAVIYGVSAKLSVDFATLPGKVTAIWLPCGLTTGLVMRYGTATMPGIVLGSLIGLLPDLLTMEPPLPVSGILFLSVAFACANCLSPGVSSAVFKRFAHPSLTFNRTRSVVAFVLGVLIGPAVSATIGITALSIVGSSPWAMYGVSWLTWWLASVVADLLFTPPFMLWQRRSQVHLAFRSPFRPPFRLPVEWGKFTLLEFALIITLCSTLLGVAFILGYPVEYSLLPVLIWAAFRLGSFLTSLLVSGISVIAIMATAHGMGPFITASKAESLLLLQSFVSVYSITTLVLAAVLQERREAQFALEQTLASLEEQVEARTAELNESKAILDSFFSAAPIGMGILDLELRYLQVNQPLAEIHGASIEQHSGKTIREVIPESASLLEPVYQQVLATGQPILNREESGTVSSKQPIERTWLNSYFPILDSNQLPSKVGVIVMDISDRKRVEDERKQVELMLRQTLQELDYHIENSPLATIRWNREFQVQYWSKQAEQIFGWKAEEVLGERICDWGFVFEADLEEVDQKVNLLSEGTSNTCVNRNYCKDGSIVTCEWYNSALLDESGNVLSTLSLVQDITQRQQAEQQLQQAKEAAEAANQAKSMFLADMSHELRTPLNSILGFSELMLLKTGISERDREFLELIHSSGNHLLKLINEILNLFKIESGKLTLENQPIDLYEQVNFIQNLLAQQIIRKQLQFQLEVAPNVPQRISVDGQKLKQVLLNLLSNAVKFTDRGTVALRVTLGSKQQHHEGDRLLLRFAVEDSGIGIAERDLPRIFEAFTQTAAGQQAREGTGLGLTISRRLVQLMGGEMCVQSKLGQGSRFEFTIPVQPLAPEIDQVSQSAFRVVGLVPYQPDYRILVVDDQPANRLLLVKLFRDLGISVRDAATGEDALDLWQEWQPHLICMDIRLPGLNGYEVTRRIRSLEQQGQGSRGAGEQGEKSNDVSTQTLIHSPTSPPLHPSTQIIALTAQALSSDRDAAFAAGCDGYITKPFQVETLLSMVSKHLGIRYLYAED